MPTGSPQLEREAKTVDSRRPFPRAVLAPTRRRRPAISQGLALVLMAIAFAFGPIVGMGV